MLLMLKEELSRRASTASSVTVMIGECRAAAIA